MCEAYFINILMVDDDEGDALMTREALKDAKFANNFSVVHDGVEALKYMQKQGEYAHVRTPDLILLDINMPRMDGHEVLSWIRSQENYKSTPVVMLTTSSCMHDMDQSYANKANCFITKPVDMEQFNKVIRSIDQFCTGIATLPSKSTA